MREILIADKQDITRAGLMYIIDQFHTDVSYKYIEDKTELILALKEYENAIVIMDYTLFDVNDSEELLILSQRFQHVDWLLFSEDLTAAFARGILVGCANIGILLKESPLPEIREAINFAISGKRYVCQRMTELLLTPEANVEEHIKLTKTETEVLKDIAIGMTTKEIAEKRYSSFHTINTHRKSIFRKLGVNNAHEATKYALRAGLVDSAEYYI